LSNAAEMPCLQVCLLGFTVMCYAGWGAENFREMYAARLRVERRKSVFCTASKMVCDSEALRMYMPTRCWESSGRY